MKKYKVIDLFAGAGGLSLGFLQTKRFNIVAAAENNDKAKLTYIRNHPSVDLFDDVKTIDYAELLKKHGKIDVVIGGPPCQGFSNANRQKVKAISLNNGLIKEYVRAIREIKPTVFVMENVSMLKSDVHRFYYSSIEDAELDTLNITLRDDVIEILPARFFQTDNNLISDSLKDYQNFLWREKDLNLINLLFKCRNNNIRFKKIILKNKKQLTIFRNSLEYNKEFPPFLIALNGKLQLALSKYLNDEIDEQSLSYVIESPLIIQKMYAVYAELVENKIDHIIIQKNGLSVKVKSYPVVEYINKMLGSSPYNYELNSGILNAANYGVPQKRERFIIIGTQNEVAVLPTPIFSENKYRTVREAIIDLEMLEPSYNANDEPLILEPLNLPKESLLSKLRNSNRLYNHTITATRETSLERFKVLTQGQNFHDLNDNLKTTYANPERTQNSIYLRLEYDKPCGTVVNVRKSMWVHPVLNRAISIREAARLQSFPDSFVFEGTKDAQYQQIGNAVPPMLAKSIAKEVLRLLKGCEDS